MTVKVTPISGAAPVGSFQGPFTGSISVNSDGTFSIDPRDMNYAENMGYVAARTDHNVWFTPQAPAAASAQLFFASAALSNGTKTIAAQATEMRPAQVIVFPGTTAISACVLTLTYDANDGTASFVDALQLKTAAGVAGQSGNTIVSTKGVMRMRSMIVTGLTGGTSPTFYIGTNTTLAVPVPPGAQNATLISEWAGNSGSVTAVPTAGAGTLTGNGIYAPTVVPTGTLLYTVSYTTLAQ